MTRRQLNFRSSTMTIIRPETRKDIVAIRRVSESAFDRPNEADLVDALRVNAHPHISLVAVVDPDLPSKLLIRKVGVVGHIFFSPVWIESEMAAFMAMGLAPMAVLPEYQKQGIGSKLVREGLNECNRIGHAIVVVLGHPKYYPRFGFTPAKVKGLRCEYDVPDEVFMVAELNPGALGGRRGLVKYHPEFRNV
jgi:putative acetyltransferase